MLNDVGQCWTTFEFDIKCWMLFDDVGTIGSLSAPKVAKNRDENQFYVLD